LDPVVARGADKPHARVTMEISAKADKIIRVFRVGLCIFTDLFVHENDNPLN
jgi:hypothetical protein